MFMTNALKLVPVGRRAISTFPLASHLKSANSYRAPSLVNLIKVRKLSDTTSNDPNVTNQEKNGNSKNSSSEAKATGANEEITKLQGEVKSLKDQVLRALAESENTRRIAKIDGDNARAYAVSSFAKSLLDIADDLERALSIVPAERRNKGDAVLDQLVIGIEMTEKNLQKTFKQVGVVKYGAVNDTFDPNIHDALYQVPDATKDTSVVAKIVKNGYKIKDRVLRPAQVGATVKPAEE